MLSEDARSGQRNTVLSDALMAAVNWEKAARKPVVAEDLDFTAKKRAMAQPSPKGTHMLSGLLGAKSRQLLKAKCFRAGAELILIDSPYASTIGAVRYASAQGRSLLNVFRAPARISVFRCEVGITFSRNREGWLETLVWLPGASFMQRLGCGA